MSYCEVKVWMVGWWQNTEQLAMTKSAIFPSQIPNLSNVA